MSGNYSSISVPKTTEVPAVVDLFSGCGGLSLGFKQAGFDIIYGAEIQEDACNTANYNLCWKYGHDSTHFCRDITKLMSEEISRHIETRDVIVIGGPPCQAYSIAGKAKLKSLGEDRVHLNDKRGYLFQDFLRIALSLNAVAVVIENVPESVNYGKINVPQTICDILSENAYTARWSILNAADYGVPQLRERMWLVALRNDIGAEFVFPSPTHFGDYLNSALRKSLKQCPDFVDPPGLNESIERRPWVTVREALSDLPILMTDTDQKYRLRPLNLSLTYGTDAEYDYQATMRRPNTMNGVTGNCFRNNSRDFKTFARMKPGNNYVDACNIAEQRLLEACIAADIKPDIGNEEYRKLRKAIVPPYEKDNFTEKWKRLDPGKPCRTVVAHMSKDTYAYIHPWEPRGISIREAARLQSFPDDFQFQGSMGEAFRQIGNAVPPLLAEALAKALMKVF